MARLVASSHGLGHEPLAEATAALVVDGLVGVLQQVLHSKGMTQSPEKLHNSSTQARFSITSCDSPTTVCAQFCATMTMRLYCRNCTIQSLFSVFTLVSQL